MFQKCQKSYFNWIRLKNYNKLQQIMYFYYEKNVLFIFSMTRELFPGMTHPNIPYYLMISKERRNYYVIQKLYKICQFYTVSKTEEFMNFYSLM